MHAIFVWDVQDIYPFLAVLLTFKLLVNFVSLKAARDLRVEILDTLLQFLPPPQQLSAVRNISVSEIQKLRSTIGTDLLVDLLELGLRA